METNSSPLVSVPVITYNSSKTVLEALESIKAQTYQNIELIISDDCSTDDTVEICKKWVSENEKRFVRTVVLESPVNTGISANGNRAEAICQGEWIKGIAGDDILLPDCVSRFISFVQVSPDAIYVFCKMCCFGDDTRTYFFVEEVTNSRHDAMSAMSSEEQLDEVLKGNTPSAPCLFYNAEKARKLGLKNDERIRMIEDWPKWINYLKTGNRFMFVDQPLVKYRIGGISTSQKWESASVFKSKRQLFYYYLFDRLYAEDKLATLEKIIEDECSIYSAFQKEQQFAEKVRHNPWYKLYKRITNCL